MAHIIKAAATTTNHIAKIAVAVTTQAIATYSNIADKAIDSNDYTKDIAAGTYAHAASHTRATAANHAAYDAIKNKIQGVVTDPDAAPAA